MNVERKTLMRPYLTAPMIVDFNITCRCNLHCAYCYANANRCLDEEELTLEEIKTIILELVRLNVLIVRLSGGEPLMRPDFREIFEFCEQQGLLICINTNGTLITDEIIQLFKRECVKKVGISLDSYLEKVHNELRGKTFAYRETVKNIKRLLGEGLGDKVDVVVTISNLNANVDEVEQYLEFLGSIGVKNISFQYAIPVGRGDDFSDCSPQYDKWKELVIWLYTNKDKYKKIYDIDYVINLTNESECKFELYFPFIEEHREDLLANVEGALSLNTNEYISCEAGNNTIAITADGKVYPCELMMCYKELEAGDLRKNSFEYIWNNSEILREIRNMKVGELEENCSICAMKEICGGGCRAAAYAYSHNIRACDKRCPRVAESIEHFVEKITLLNREVIVRKEFDGYYFSHPISLKMYHFNNVGYYIFKNLLMNFSKRKIVELLIVKFNFTTHMSEEILEEFLVYLYNEGLIEDND